MRRQKLPLADARLRAAAAKCASCRLLCSCNWLAARLQALADCTIKVLAVA
jgi:hypothetical protein